MSERFAIAAGRVVTSDGDGLGAHDDAAVVVEDGRIAWIGPARELGPDVPRRIDVPNGLVTAGLIDAHTHAAFMGSRHAEYAVRMAGGDYEAIAKAGGGILSTQRAVAAATEAEIADALAARLVRMARLGVTTVEVKSGYGLVHDEELKQLRAIRTVAARADVPRVVPTYLGLHALPKGHDRAAFVQDAIDRTLPVVAAEGLARFVDAYVDRAAFQAPEAEALALRARALGLGVRLHVGQFADIGGAELAAAMGAASADHLEVVSDAGIRALRDQGTIAMLLPIASFTLGQAPPPVARMRAAGVILGVASDANPGTAPTESLPLALALAVRTYGLTIDEAVRAVTVVGARALARPDLGRLHVGGPADLVVWDLPHEAALAQPWGTSKTLLVLREGAVLHHA